MPGLTAIAVLGLTLFALALRLFHLSFVSLRGDEAFTALFSASSFLDEIRQLRTIEPHPPLYYFVLFLTRRLAGDSELALRLPSVAWGTLMVPLSYVAARRAIGSAVAVPTALLVAVNPFLVWHSQDARNYTLVPALALGAAYFAARLLGGGRDGRARFAWIGLGVSQGLLLLSHYAGAYFVAVLNLVALGLAFGGSGHPRLASLARDLRGRPGDWLRAQALTALMALPWWLFARDIILNRVIDWLVPLDPLTQAWRTFSAYSLGPIDVGGSQAGLLLLFAIGSLLGVASLVRSTAGRSALVVLAVPLLAGYLTSLNRTSFVDRYFVYVVPIYACVLAAGAVALDRKSRPLAALLLACFLAASGYSLGLQYFDPRQAKAPDWRGSIGEVIAGFAEGDSLLIDTADPAAAYYAHRRTGRDPSAKAVVDETLPRATNKSELTSRLSANLRENERVWLLPTSDATLDPDGLTALWLDAAAMRLRSWRVGDLEFRLYATPRALLTARPRPEARSFALGPAGARIEFLGADLAVQPFESGTGAVRLRPGDSLWLTLFFRPTTDVAADLRVFNHLTDASGATRGQHDGSPADGKRPTYTWRAGDLILDRHQIVVADTAPAGSYRVNTGLYDPATLQRLPMLDSAGAPIADAVETEGVTIER